MPSRFVHLHTHSHYSLLSALPKIPELIAAAKANNMNALALTDNGNLYGAIEFYKACKHADIKPIIGVDAYVAARGRKDKEHGIDDARARLVLLAENLTGYKNLLKLVTKANIEGFYYKPRADHELLREHAKGLIAILPSWSGEIANALRGNDETRAEKLLGTYRDIYGAESVFLEITHHPEQGSHETLQKKIVAFAQAHRAPLLAAHDVYYLHPEDKRARDTLLSIQGNLGAQERQKGFGDEDVDFSFISGETAENYFRDTPQAIENTHAVAERCSLELELGKWVFPDVPKGNRSYDEELRRIVHNGIPKRGLSESPKLTERIEYELGIITQKGYAPYFLVVSDLLRYAHDHNILTTIRGSVAGSMVTYLAGITNVNPFEYNLPFERFLNPERPSAPDIDMDYADNRRDEVIQYAREKYGEDKVAQIGTFGTMMARGAVRDVTRALGHPYGLGDRIAKHIPMGSQGFPMTIDNALEINPELKELYRKEKDAKEIIDLAKKIEGCARHISVHAAGVVIAPSPLSDYVPLQLDPKGGKIITQYDMHAVEDAGLLKFDFLGIRNLSILAHSVRLVQKTRGANIDIEKIPLDDPKTFEMLARGETMGLFQLNGSGMTRYLKELKPSSINDINAMVALYRPGPMESIPSYIERKHNPKLIRHIDPRMEEILSQSYGVITYQDDVLLIAIRLAGYSWLEADKLRKAMGKKIPAEMEAQKEKFISGCVEHGMVAEKASAVWKLIEPFAAYGFNKAHAASYGRVAYQTAHMKANFPIEYMAAVLTADAGDIEKTAEIVGECKRMGVPVLPPNINESFGDFTVVLGKSEGTKEAEALAREADDDAIRFGLCSIKNFGSGVADSIITERKERGRFASLADFLERIRDKNLNKKSLEALVKSGALDDFGERGALLGNIDLLLSYNKESTSALADQDSLFGLLPQKGSSLVIPETPPATKSERLQWEKELLGLYVSGHPLDAFKEKLDKRPMDIRKFKEEMREGMQGVVAGLIEEVKPILTKGGEHMAFVRLADLGGSIEIVLFPRVLSLHKELIVPEKAIAVKGRLSGRNGETSFIAEAVKAL